MPWGHARIVLAHMLKLSLSAHIVNPLYNGTGYNIKISKYEGKSISNQPIPFPMDRDGQDFHAFFSIHVLYFGTKWQTYRVIL